MNLWGVCGEVQSTSLWSEPFVWFSSTATVLISPQPPCCGTKNTLPSQGSVERSRRIQAILLDTSGVSGDGHVWKQEGLNQWQKAPFTHNLTNIHNLIMTFTPLIWPQSLTGVHMQADHHFHPQTLPYWQVPKLNSWLVKPPGESLADHEWGEALTFSRYVREEPTTCTEAVCHKYLVM